MLRRLVVAALVCASVIAGTVTIAAAPTTLTTTA
jgi:hypothetical protein